MPITTATLAHKVEFNSVASRTNPKPLDPSEQFEGNQSLLNHTNHKDRIQNNVEAGERRLHSRDGCWSGVAKFVSQKLG